MKLGIGSVATTMIATTFIPALDFGQENGLPGSAARFSDFPEAALYDGPIASPKLGRAADEPYRTVISAAVKNGPNFAARYVLATFHYGDGPVGAVVVDARSGLVFHLPSKVVGKATSSTIPIALLYTRNGERRRRKKTMIPLRCRSCRAANC